ncbi:MAG: DNA primase, partial [Chloroflexi bacterium]|nr:DNA primase [Chloroflexota bacterium]
MTVVDDIKSRVDILEVVSRYVPLQRSGRSNKANCPFHQEKTPSFFVFPDRQTWRCFGACATGGDVFSFVMRAENLEFGDALKSLA